MNYFKLLFRKLFGITKKEALSDLPLSKLWELATECSQYSEKEIREFLTTVILGENIDLKSMDY